MADDAQQPAERPAADITVVEAAETETRRTLIVAFGVVILAALALGTYIGVKSLLRDLRGGELAALRDAQVNALQLWLGQRATSAARWADQREVQDAADRLAREGTSADSRRLGCESQEAKRVVAAMRPALHERGFTAFDLVNRDGRVVATSQAAECDARWGNEALRGRLDSAFGGRAQFVRPQPTGERGKPPSPGKGSLVWFLAPVRDASTGSVVAVLAMAESTENQFARVLAVPGLGKSDEAYAFSSEGLMLSEARHLEPAREANLLVDMSLGHTALNLELRDPGVDLTDDATPDPARTALPLTRLVGIAIAARSRTTQEEQGGVLTEPYRNYLGVPVIGAWRWLPDLDLGVAIEIERDEAYAPLRALERAFAVVLGLTVAAGVGVLISVLAALRERRRFGRLTKLGRYALIEEIGEGGMATVYRGRHELLKRPIAVKILKRHATDEWIARFKREVQHASRLGHPNVVEIFDYGVTRSGEFYYVMEYLEGLTLAQLVARDGAVPVARAVHLLRQLAAALRAAHNEGIVHRDIKPENIMVCSRGGESDVVKVLDFGLVKGPAEDDTRDLTRSILRVLGTPVYMSPERFDEPGNADPRGDLYSFGAVAYLLITGRRLFAGFDDEALQFQIRSALPPAPASFAELKVPPALDALIMQCLAKRAPDRPASATEIADRLRELALEHPWSYRDADAWWQAYRASTPRPGVDSSEAKRTPVTVSSAQ